MNIVIFTDSYYPEANGIAISSKTLVDVLKENEKELNFERIKAFYTRYYEEYLGYVSKSSKIMSKIL